MIFLTLFLNLWIYKIFGFSFLLGILLVGATFALYKRHKLFYLFLILVLLFQYKTTHKIDLLSLSNDEQRIQVMRLREYPPDYLRIGYWIEARDESIVFFRVLKNFSEAVSPNLYFFANHPRGRVGVDEFEKFPFGFLPFFFIGIYNTIEKRNGYKIWVSILLSLFLISFVGNVCPIGPFSLFPAIAVLASRGLTVVQKKTSRPIFVSLIVLIFVTFIQAVAYEKY